MDKSSILEHIREELREFKDKESTLGASHSWEWSGELEAAKVHSITQELENELLQIGVQKQVQKRTFTILIEGLQNILIHSSRKGDTPFYGVAVAYIDDRIDILLIGLADSNHIEKVSSLVSELNAMDASEIKEHYRFTMRNGKMSEKGGAGLGLITMVMKSQEGMRMVTKDVGSGLYLLKTHLSAGSSLAPSS